jgi:hypothetical protein
MGSDKSERVLVLLKELSLLKELESAPNDGSATDSEQGADGVREQEIAEEIKALSEEKKNPD